MCVVSALALGGALQGRMRYWHTGDAHQLHIALHLPHLLQHSLTIPDMQQLVAMQEDN